MGRDPRVASAVRVARICKAPGCNRRVFGKSGWECEEHPGKTVDQPNRPYFGRDTSGGRVEKPKDAA